MPVIEVKGLDELVAKLRELASGKYLGSVVRASRARLMKRLSQTPPKSVANQPKPAPGRWYERGYGPRWARRGGSRGGRRTSEKLTSSWVARSNPNGLVISNRAFYAHIVMGPKRQSALHRRRGWTPVDEILDEEAPRVEADLVRAVEDIFKK